MVTKLRRKTEPYAVATGPKAGEFTKEVKLVKGSLIKNCCKVNIGGICGSVFEELTIDNTGKVVKSMCYPAGHERKIKQHRQRKETA